MSIKVYVNGREAPKSSFIFKGGEVQVAVALPSQGFSDVLIEAVLKDSNDVMELLMVTDAIKHQVPASLPIHLVMPYVPYARQDRVMNPGEALSIKVFCNLINSQNYASVTIHDPHSDVTPALLNNVKVIPQQELLCKDLDLIIGDLELTKYLDSGLPKDEALYQARQDRMNSIVLVSPDAGANKKILKVAQYNGFSHVVRADKVRDVKTNNILETVVYSNPIGSKDFLIVDDCCDGGRTFIELAKVLRPLTNGKIILYVTHGIFSYGLEVFKGFIDEVYCSHSFGKYPQDTNLMSLNYV